MFERNGYVRLPNPTTKQRLERAYRKGHEVRLALSSEAEVEKVRLSLLAVGLKPGKPFLKHSKVVLPIYGRSAVEWFATTKVQRESGES